MKLKYEPTRGEMLAFIALSGPPLGTEFDIEEGVYWFCNNYHSGQGSALYEAMCQSPFKPGSIAVLSSESVASFVYSMLEDEYCALGEDTVSSLLTSDPNRLVEDKDLYDKE